MPCRDRGVQACGLIAVAPRDYLNEHQGWLLFRQVLEARGIELDDEAHYQRKLSLLSNLTPGDFATILRQHYLVGSAVSPASLLSGLREEAYFKERDVQNPIGFLAEL